MRKGSLRAERWFRLRRAAAVLVALSALVASRPGRAFWRDTREVVLATAHTLERGAFALGVLSPLQYGLLDQLMLTTHPVLHLLLTPNVGIRGRLYDGPVVLSVQGGYQQTFLGEAEGGGYPGVAHGELVLSLAIWPEVGLTAHAGYAWRFPDDDHAISFGGAVHVLATRYDLVMVQADGRYSVTRGAWDWSTTLLYARAWNAFHLGGGVAVGRLAFMPWEDVTLHVKGVPIYPVVDAWWQF